MVIEVTGAGGGTPLRDLATRVARYQAVSGRLAGLDDARLTALLDGATVVGAGIGGTTAEVVVDGVPVFVKRVPLTDLERRPEHVGGTANLFHLPTFYQYGVGSAGFGAWREVAVHAMTTRWVLENRVAGFPILYHWRVLPQPPQPVAAADLDSQVAYWEGSAAVRDRLTAIGESSAAVVLFMEHIPETVDSWLTERTARGGQAAASAYTMVDRGLRSVVDFLRSQGLLHFDAHFRNLLTDGQRVYFADFGLAVHSGFQLSAAESAFLRRHRDYDRCYTVTHLVTWLVSNLAGVAWGDCYDHLRDRADGRAVAGLPESAARIVNRDLDVAVLLGGFFRSLQQSGKRVPYPAEELSRALHRLP